MVQGAVRTLRQVLVLLLLCWLAACSVRPTVTVEPEVLPELAMPAGDALRGSPAESLLARADEAVADGKLQAASLSLERALRLVPDSSWLYRRQAMLELQQGRMAAAEGAARRALQLADSGDDKPARYYRANLMELLATALAGQGRQDAAADTRASAAALRH